MIGKLIRVHATKAYDKILLEKLAKITDEPAFWNKESSVYVQKRELADYHYLSFKVTGPIEIKTNIGLTLRFEADNASFELNSESEFVEGDHSPISMISITEFDVDYDQNFIQFLQSETINKIQLTTKNGQFIKTHVRIEFGQINQLFLLHSLS